MIGILDLQGDVAEHVEHLRRLGIPARRVKVEADFAGLAGLILPGGESTCLGRLLRIFELDRVIRREHARGMKLWGTCAGAILLAHEIEGEKPYLDLIDITIRRNAFGSQLDSFNATALVPAVDSEPVQMTFIRAPKIERTGPRVNVLLRLQEYIAAAESDQVLVTIFHPELTPCLAFHAYFARKCGLRTPTPEQVRAAGATWADTSWTREAFHFPVTPETAT